MAIWKSCFAVVACVLVVSCQAFIEDPTLKDPKLLEEKNARSIFHKFVAYHDKEYAGDREEWEKRFGDFHKNMKLVAEHNQKDLPYKLALNEHADVRDDDDEGLPPLPPSDVAIDEEFNPFPRGIPGHSECTYKLADVKYPTKIDWREHGVIAAVRNEAKCASDWAYATTTMIESLYAIMFGELIELSDQAQIDCNWRMGGCAAGDVETALKWVVANGLPQIESYPRAYKSEQGTCNVTLTYNMEFKAAYIDTYEKIPKGENNLKKAVAVGPTAVSLDFPCDDFKFYHSGVYTQAEACAAKGKKGKKRTYNMVAVGFNADGDDDGIPYWILRNSKGDKWGEGGYMKMAMYAGEGDAGLYGLAAGAIRPVKDGSVDFHLWSKLPSWAKEAQHQVRVNMRDMPLRLAAIKEKEEAEKAAEEERAGRIKDVIVNGMQGEGYRRLLH
mmetsp:Transcript_25116/g.54652  ORF Transcript_25116/g.54652 Transcript_25116/m.54652 type:complete len:443 (-) Transcript_25116:185-1513(-)|eukprot:CAMPEP_0118931660 /NCGR_PEP_ID=MMETSP1169-20130426/7921_1 /TAXON_ID=36882 /ORGANISM="Pyramimonas obovata, Strain CCMP722" /LENGTH=442 /DNA_ID=CAMNT_0006874187 /DNA_START=93 /DNA_END=1421 /DNA_ORIENTATION=+